MNIFSGPKSEQKSVEMKSLENMDVEKESGSKPMDAPVAIETFENMEFDKDNSGNTLVHAPETAVGMETFENLEYQKDSGHKPVDEGELMRHVVEVLEVIQYNFPS